MLAIAFGSELVTDSQREACAVGAMRAMLEDLSSASGVPLEGLLLEFAASRTYEALFDFETRVWAEGPDYLRGLWEREKGAGT